ncbi:MAG: ABC transporter substrate-binding protein [Limnochordales bacterium]|nr:ABC transporter substrate-binding protein [Limnochordales bacterium]
MRKAVLTALSLAVLLAFGLAGAGIADAQTLRIGVVGDIDNFDPHWNQLIAFRTFIRNTVFSSLVRLDENMRVIPELAESWEQPDDTTYIFRLRRGVTFHDGRPFTAEDVAYSFERTIENQMTFATKLATVESWQVLDDYTLQVNLKHPWAPFLDDLVEVAIVPKGAGDELRSRPVGTGPFRFVEWLPNDRIVLEKNPDYWNAGHPKLDRIVIRVMPNATVALANLQGRELDAVWDVPVAEAQSVARDPNVVWQRPAGSGSILLVEINASEGPLADRRVRQALAHALNKMVVQRTTYFGEGEAIWSPLPPFSWAYEPQAGYDFNPNRARELLAEAGYGSGLTLTVDVISDVKVMEDLATVWQAGLAQAGVQLEIRRSALPVWLDRYVNHDYELIINTFNVSGDPNSMFDVIFRPLLASVYDNQAMLDLILEGARTSDEAARAEIYKQLQRMTVEEVAPVLIVQTQPVLAVTSPAVTVFPINGRNEVMFERVEMR